MICAALLLDTTFRIGIGTPYLFGGDLDHLSGYAGGGDFGFDFGSENTYCRQELAAKTLTIGSSETISMESRPIPEQGCDVYLGKDVLSKFDLKIDKISKYISLIPRETEPNVHDSLTLETRRGTNFVEVSGTDYEVGILRTFGEAHDESYTLGRAVYSLRPNGNTKVFFASKSNRFGLGLVPSSTLTIDFASKKIFVEKDEYSNESFLLASLLRLSVWTKRDATGWWIAEGASATSNETKLRPYWMRLKSVGEVDATKISIPEMLKDSKILLSLVAAKFATAINKKGEEERIALAEDEDPAPS